MMVQVNTPKIVGNVNWTIVYLTVINNPSGGRRTRYWMHSSR